MLRCPVLHAVTPISASRVMSKELQKYLGLDVGELLEHPEFQALATADGVSIPTAYTELVLARAMLLGLREESIVMPTAEEKKVDFAMLMERTQVERLPVVRRLWPRLAGMAATLLLLLAAGIWLLRPTEAVVYATGNGELQEITLEDGTAVTLNGNSSLALPVGGWSAAERLVELDGEAFFAVTKQRAEGEARPFLVRTNGAIIRVLGTRFNVKERRAKTQVFLEEGIVQVNWPDASIPELTLRPGELVDLDQAVQQSVVKPVFKPEQQTAWTRGHLIFDRLPLVEVLLQISDLYGVNFKLLEPALGQREVSSAGIPVDNFSVAVRLLEKALDLRIEAKEDNVYWVSAPE